MSSTKHGSLTKRSKSKTLELRIAKGLQGKTHLFLPQPTKETIEQIRIMLEGLCGVSVANSVLTSRALEICRDHLVDLLMKANEMPLSDRELIDLMGALHDEREALFSAAGRGKDCWNPRYGRTPTIKELTGADFKYGERALKLANRLKILAAGAAGSGEKGQRAGERRPR